MQKVPECSGNAIERQGTASMTGAAWIISLNSLEATGATSFLQQLSLVPMPSAHGGGFKLWISCPISCVRFWRCFSVGRSWCLCWLRSAFDKGFLLHTRSVWSCFVALEPTTYAWYFEILKPWSIWYPGSAALIESAALHIQRQWVGGRTTTEHGNISGYLGLYSSTWRFQSQIPIGFHHKFGPTTMNFSFIVVSIYGW